MSPDLRTVRVWDLPTRIYHWALTALIVFSVVTVNIGGNWMEWHFRSGYAILTLMLFRVIWGFVGGRYARFSSFVFGPRAVIGHLRGAEDAPRTLGHNPLGSLSVWALLAFIAFQAGSGLFASDEIAYDGPLVKFVSSATSTVLTRLHKWNDTVLYVLVGLHVAAILYYLWRKRENLVRPMLTGDKQIGVEWPASRDDAALRMLAVVVVAISAGVVWLIVTWPSSAS